MIITIFWTNSTVSDHVIRHNVALICYLLQGDGVFCTLDVLSVEEKVEEKCMGLECRRKGLEESCPLHVGRTGGRWIEMDWRTARPSGPQVGGIHTSVLHHIVFLFSF